MATFYATASSSAGAAYESDGIETGVWDPLVPNDVLPTARCLMRIKKDIMNIYKEPPPGICIVQDTEDMTKIHAMIIGPFDTPYEGGFFYFLMKCPPEYPMKPPRVRLMTTGNGKVRFNPNLYKNGKVCLSILGTWPGPAWRPTQSLSSVLISLQSLMNEKPYHNEPGYEKLGAIGATADAQRYNDIICHETLRVAVCDMLESRVSVPEKIKELTEKSFSTYYKYYISVCEKQAHYQSHIMQVRASYMDPFGEKRGKFDYKAIRKRLETLKSKLDEKYKNGADSSDSDKETS